MVRKREKRVEDQKVSLELSPEQRAILDEFANARELKAMTGMRGWDIYQTLVEGCIKDLEDQHLAMRNISKEALWANHIAIQQIRGFYTKLHNQISNRLEIARNPESALIAIESINASINPADYEGEIQ